MAGHRHIMRTVEAGVGWVNPVDQKFVKAIRASLKEEGISFHEITYANLEQAFEDVHEGRIFYRSFIDRSSVDDPSYFLIAEKLKEQGAHVINDPHQTIRFNSKAVLHKAFELEKLPVPKTFLIPPHKRSREYLNQVVAKLGVPFVLKPAHGGAGENVVMTARTVEDILNFLKANSTDVALAQEYITISLVDLSSSSERKGEAKTAWFRPIFAAGLTIPLWWDPRNHFYQEFGRAKRELEIAQTLEQFCEKIHGITGLELFSTEVTIDRKERYLVIDYANHPIDLNTQEVVPDGLPEQTLQTIASQIVKSIKSRRG